jgi:hypothetical protein
MHSSESGGMQLSRVWQRIAASDFGIFVEPDGRPEGHGTLKTLLEGL